MMICFGKGEHAWTNHSDSKLTQQLRQEIARFERALKWIHRLEPFFVFVSISKVRVGFVRLRADILAFFGRI